MQVLAFAGNEFLHQREAEPLRRTAFDLSLDQHGIDGSADVVRGDQPNQLHRAKLDIDLDLGQMRAEAIDGIRVALTVSIERSGRRIERRLC